MKPLKTFLITAGVMLGAAAINEGANKLPQPVQFLKAPLIGIAALLVKNPFAE
jgi:hypothetical protein